jgi:hypothetical protein
VHKILTSIRKKYSQEKTSICLIAFFFRWLLIQARNIPCYFSARAYEKGNDNEAQLDIGGRYFLADSNRRNFPAVIVFPQCPSNDVWAYFDAEFDSAGVLKRAVFPFSQRTNYRHFVTKTIG